LTVMIDSGALIRAGHKRKSLWRESIAVKAEHAVSYKANFGIKNEDIGGKNSYFFKDSSYISKK